MPPIPSLRAGFATSACYLILVATPAVYAEPVPDAAITEFVADNNNSLLDADGDASDWIEIWNSSGEAGDLGGYYLTDDPDNLTKWQLPAATFNAEGYAVVFASGKDRTDPAAEIHTNFRLDASAGAYLALVKPDGSTLASEFVDYPEQYEDVGYGSGFGDAQPVQFVSAGDTARWFVPSGEVAGWTLAGFDDSTWDSGATGIGFDNGADYLPLIGAGGDVNAAMRGVNPGIFIRIPFQIEDPAGISGLTLRMKWDDGFVAYLNGAEIHRESAPANAVWNSVATSSRSPESQVFSFDVYAANGGTMQSGTNVLAIHGLNQSVSSSDFIIVPELAGQQQDLSNPQNGYFVEPTPGAGNGVRVDGLVRDTRFSNDRGTYDTPFDLVISTATEGAEIRYTLDGSPPSPDQGLIYTAPIPVTTTTVVRAMAHRPGFEPTNIDTHTYVFPESVYGSGFTEALTAVPTISVVTQHASFLSENSANDYNEYQSSFEMIFPDGRPSVQEDGGMSNFGGRFTNFSKKSFRIAFKKEFGSTKLRYPIFEGFDYPNYPPVQEFDAINLRSGSHDMVNRGGYMSTRFADDSMLEMGNIAPHGRFVHLYLNGEYWGQYHLRERWNADMAASYFGGSKEDYDAISANNTGMEFLPGTAYDGTQDFWTEANNLMGRRPFTNAAGHIDIPNMVDFMLLWTSGECESEFRAFGSQSRGIPFKFMMRDPDGFMPGSGWGHVHPVTHNGPMNAMTELRTGGNPDFAMLVADRIHKHFFNDGALTADKSVERLRKRVEEARPGFAAEARRWNYRSVSSWESYVNGWLDTQLPQRTPAMIAKFKAAGMSPDVIAPVFSQHGGSIPPGAGITMSTNATAVYYTLDGSDPRLPGGAVNPDASLAPFADEVPTPQDFLTTGHVWSYLDDGSDQGTAWRASAFDDSSWASGPSELGYNEGDEATVVGYVDTDPAGGTQRNATTYFRTTVELSDPGDYSFFVVKLKYDDAAAVYANGVEVLRTANLPANATFDTFATSSTPDERTYFEFQVPSSRFSDGTNSLAVEIHNQSPSSSDISFDMVLRGEVDLTNGDNVTEPVSIDEPATLRARAYNVSTGEWSALNEAFFSVGSVPADASNLAISELHYHPAEPSTPAELAVSSDRDDYEFVEFLNTGAAPIELTGVYFTDGINFSFAQNTLLDPSERLVIVRNQEAFTARYGSELDVTIAGTYSGRLSNDGEQLRLFSDTTGTIVEFVYNDQLPWPTLPDGGGASLVLVGAVPSDETSWGANAVHHGAPGSPDSVISSGYLAWKNANNILNDLGDADDDGIANLAEYTLGTQPRNAESSARPSASITTDAGSDYLTITYQKNLSADDVTLAVQRSSDLDTWVSAEPMVLVSETENPDGETAVVVLREASPIDPGTETFLRISIALN